MKARLNRQYLSKAVLLQYTENDLKNIFCKYITKEAEENIAIHDYLKTNPIKSFLGLSKINNLHCNVEEDIFKYIYRHTLGRPRDFMQMGMAISSIPVENRSQEEIIKVIDYQTSSLVKDYIFEEVKPFNTELDINEIFKRVPANVLTRKQLKTICSKINSFDCVDIRCKECDKIHIFCSLFKYGLIGHVQPDSGKKRLKQFFYKPGEVSFESNVKLAKSEYYLIHPVLYKYICDINPFFEFYQGQVVGPNYDWETAPSKSEAIKYSLKLKKILEQSHLNSVDQDINNGIWELIEEEQLHYHSENEPGDAINRQDLNSAYGTLLGKTDITFYVQDKKTLCEQ